MDIFRPDIYRQSIYDIDYKKLKEQGIKCLIFDLDNTLVPIDEDVPNKNLKEFIFHLEEMGFRVAIVSNSSKNRVCPFKEQLNVDSSFHSCKPFKKKFKKILKLYKLNIYEVILVGDQLLTDILGANRMGFTSILVNQVGKKDYFWTSINRKIEKYIYKYLEKNKLLKRGVYYE